MTLPVFDPNEKPLDTLLADGGNVGIFRTIACIGDSLSSGEFEGTGSEGQKTYHDMYDYSWGQYMARIAGCKVYNFSKGGMSAWQYRNTFADDRGLWNRDLACQAYIMALGVNDISGALSSHSSLGSIEDIDPENWGNNKRTFIGDYAAILQRYREIAPDSFVFLMTIPRSGVDDERAKLCDEHRALLYKLAELFPNTFVLDLRAYAPVYDDAFKSQYYLGGHMNPMGYLLTARMVVSYIDYIIRSDMPRFAQVGFINTPWKNTAK